MPILRWPSSSPRDGLEPGAELGAHGATGPSEQFAVGGDGGSEHQRRGNRGGDARASVVAGCQGAIRLGASRSTTAEIERCPPRFVLRSGRERRTRRARRAPRGRSPGPTEPSSPVG